MKISKTLAAVLLMMSAISLTACGNPNSTPAQTTGQNMDQAAQNVGNAVETAARNAGNAVSDTVITSKVKAAILAEPNLKTLQISVDTENGVVTLTGTVDSQQNSDLAARIASGVDGVKSVDNKLTVK